MSAPTVLFRISLAAAALLCMLPGTSLAEVGMVVSDRGATAAVGPYLCSIIDDSDPVTGIWITTGPDRPRRRVLNAQGDLLGDGPPTLLRHGSTGLPLVAWARNSESGFDVVLSRFESDDSKGSKESEQDVDDRSSTHYRSPWRWVCPT